MISIQFTNVPNVEEEIRIMSEKYIFKSIERYTCWYDKTSIVRIFFYENAF